MSFKAEKDVLSTEGFRQGPGMGFYNVSKRGAAYKIRVRIQ